MNSDFVAFFQHGWVKQEFRTTMPYFIFNCNDFPVWEFKNVTRRGRVTSTTSFGNICSVFFDEPEYF